MNRHTWHRWGIAGLLLLGTLVAVLFGLLPFHRSAQRVESALATATAECEAKAAILAALPGKQLTLNELVLRISTFRDALHSSDEIDAAMQALADRAQRAGITLWTLDPSLPTMLTLDRARDSVAALNLALLPVSFECRGDFVTVGRFLEAEERRPAHGQWKRLMLTPGSRPGTVHARAEMIMYLLPAASEQGGAAG